MTELSRVTKGRLSVIETDEVYVFMFNPNRISDNKSTNFPEQPVPGMSHPVLQFGSGSSRLLSFNLYLDGDRGTVGLSSVRNQENLARRPRLLDPWESAADRRRSAGTGVTKSIQTDLDFLYSLQLPIATEGIGLPDVHPPTVLFSFGEHYLGLECVVEKVFIDVNYWNTRLEPIRADVSITLKQKVARSVARSVIWDTGSVRL
jgi:hypothetical protein